MIAATIDPDPAPARRSGPGQRPQPEPIPMTRIVEVELRKMFDTRSGFWLMASIVIVSTLATIGTVLIAPDDQLTYETFLSAVGFPMNVILPMIAILSVTSEWSQRSALTTFTLVPSRGRVITAKAILTVLIGMIALAIAAVLGALGTIAGSAIAGVDTTWNMGWQGLVLFALANVLGMAIGFTLAVLLRSSPAAIVSYFVYYLVLPIVFAALASYQPWFDDNLGWLDFNTNVGQLFGATFTGPDALSGQQWIQLGVTGAAWLVIPLAIGLRLVLRSEVK